ncbi:dolichyl pyrophosphate alpha-1 [Scenedesmus sp. PABB004]|nr:dolichyl pyrophosphate alpha-1 [Scenedesmus sp. PABB004]
MDWRHRLLVVVLAVQLLLAAPSTYRSTDFEVHRNWLAITYQLPISKWYYEATSEWTLDYPPLFAWFEWVLARAAAAVDPAMLELANLGHASAATVAFQRASVAASGLVLAGATLAATRRARDAPPGLTAVFLTVANAGLLMVDSIHFQYNAFLLGAPAGRAPGRGGSAWRAESGQHAPCARAQQPAPPPPPGVLMWSLLALEAGRPLLGGLLFAALLNLKHLFAFMAPPYFVYLLRHHVLDDTAAGPAGAARPARPRGGAAAAAARLAALGGGVAAVFGASLGPFVAMGQLRQVLSRLFPFARGLCHAYWAPNAWALYAACDKLASAAGAAAGLLRRPAAAANMAGGVVGVASFAVLPDVGPRACAALVAAALAPALVALWRAAPRDARAMLAPALAYANLCGFVFGYHVHEKAALAVELPLALAAVRDPDWGGAYLLLSSAAHVGLFPLLFGHQELPLRWALAAAHAAGAAWGLHATHAGHGRRHRAAMAPGGGAAGGAGEAAPGVRTRRAAAAEAAPEAGAGVPRAAAPAPAAAPSMGEVLGWLPRGTRLYVAGLAAVEAYASLGHAALLRGRLPFVPLLLTSTYCALGVCAAWAWMAAWFVARAREGRSGGAARAKAA